VRTEHPAADSRDGRRDTQEFVLVGVGAGDELAVLRLVDGRARRGEAECAGAQCLLHVAGHLDDVGVGGRLVRRTAVAHDVGAQRAVRNGRADVEHSRQLLEHVEVLGVGLPAPLDALGERAAGDVLYALHQLDEPLVTVGRCGSKAHTTVAHQRGGDAVPSRRGDEWVPRDLRVVVSVHIDPARSEQQTVGLDGAGRSPDGSRRLDRGDVRAIDGDVGGAAGLAAAVDEVCVAEDEVVDHPSIFAQWCNSPFEEMAVSCS
jgi:hypothetical protein